MSLLVDSAATQIDFFVFTKTLDIEKLKIFLAKTTLFSAAF